LVDIGTAFLELLRARWPEFAQHASVDECGSLVVTMPSPRRSDGTSLWLSADADSDEVIVAFGGGHSHGGPWLELCDVDYQFQASARLLDDVLAERVVGCTIGGGGGAIGSLDQMRSASWWSDVRAIRSWLGTHDWDAV
tara:strand:- start:331 stop:747 length:417 start_codon:yes stop_codon:yes gene_type:complete